MIVMCNAAAAAAAAAADDDDDYDGDDDDDEEEEEEEEEEDKTALIRITALYRNSQIPPLCQFILTSNNLHPWVILFFLE